MTTQCQELVVYPSGYIQGVKLQLESVQFIGQIISIYEWKLDTTTLSNITSIIIIDTSLLSIGQHTVSHRIKNSCGTWSEYVTKQINIIAPPCIPDWQCREPLDGYEHDINNCGEADRLNPDCNPICIPEWICEIPLNGYESDGCGNTRLNPICNPCIPNWVCELPLNGYENDGCDNRRLNPDCNPCIPNWTCDIPLNGYESDGCGNTRLNPICNPIIDKGCIYFYTYPTGAKIYLDDIDTGTTTPEYMCDISIGTHTYKLTLNGYYDLSGSEVVYKDSVATVSIDLIKICLPCISDFYMI